MVDMLDYRLHYAVMAAEDRRREHLARRARDSRARLAGVLRRGRDRGERR